MKKASTVWRHALAENDDQNRSGMQNGGSWKMRVARETLPGLGIKETPDSNVQLFLRVAIQRCHDLTLIPDKELWGIWRPEWLPSRLHVLSVSMSRQSTVSQTDFYRTTTSSTVHVAAVPEWRHSARTVTSSELTCVIGSYQPPQQPGRQWEPTTCPFPTPRYDVVWSPSIWTVVDRTLDNVSHSDTALHDTTGLFCIDSGGTDSGRTPSSPTKAATA